MRRFLALLIVIVIAVGVLGYSRGWFAVSHTSGEHEAGVNVTVDKDRMKEDKEKATQGIREKTRGLSPNADKETGTPSP